MRFRHGRLSGIPLGVGALGLVVLSGCATIGKPFPTDPVTQIRLGETTQADIKRQFGEPWRTGIEDGKRTWTFGHYKYSAFRAARTTDLVVRFDPQGKVVSYTYNTTEGEKE